MSSGIIPIDHRVLIVPDEVKSVTAGGVFLPDQEVEKQKFAATRATLVSAGPLCWAEAKYDADRFGVDARFPKAGDRILVGRYTGDRHKGADGQEYIIINDADIIGFLE